jgi:hypothetical protein
MPQMALLPKSKLWRTIIIVLGCFVLLVTFFYAEEDWRGWHAWQKFKREWEAKGEKFDLASIVPQPVPDDQNIALTPIVFTSYGNMLTRDGKAIPHEQRDTDFVNRLKMPVDFNGDGPTNAIGNWQKGSKSDLQAWQNYYRKLAATTNTFPAPPQPQTPAQDVLLALSKYDLAIEELREASRLPYTRFPLEYDKDNPAAILLPHLASLKGVTQTLRLRAIAELQSGQTEKALDDVKLSLRLADSIRNEPLLISHLVRIAILNITLQPIYEGLAEHKWSDAQLVILDSELSKLDFLADYKLAMHGEIGFQDGIVRYLRQHSGQYLNLLGDASDYGNMSPAEFVVATAMHWHLVPSGWFYQNQLHCARAMEEFYLPVADVNQQIVMPALIRQADVAVEKERKNLTPFNILESLMLPALGNATKKFAYAQSSTDLARIAVALERYHLAHGEYPETLDALAPQFIEKIPHDIIGGQPLHYRRTDDGKFLLYSVGWNETDDGGQYISPQIKTGGVDYTKGDWVWKN